MSREMMYRYFLEQEIDEEWEDYNYTNYRPRSAYLPLSKPSGSRSSSRLSLREKKTEKKENEILVDKFRRSLKLLGLNVEDLNLKPSECPPPKPDLKSAKPRVETRLVRRTVSEEDLLGKPLFKKGVERQLLSKAIYETWYFKKEEELKKEKAKIDKGKQIKAWEQEMAKRENVLKNKECYEDWVNKKTFQEKNKKIVRPKTSDERTKGKDKNIKDGKRVEESEEAFLAWKKKKESLLKEEKRKQEERKKEIEMKERKKLEAEKAFESWKKKVDEELKVKEKEKEEKERAMKEREARATLEKKKEAEASFNSWKEKKDRILKEKLIKEKIEKEMTEESKVEARRVRRYEANQAFLEWLDSVDERVRR